MPVLFRYQTFSLFPAPAMGVSTFLQGEYGFSDVSIGAPVVLGRNGIGRI
jgi:malate/lactate dehydrogenase